MPLVEIAPEQKISYAARGAAGVPVVFIHGAGASHLIWNAQLAGLADRCQCMAIDLPGHGRSSMPGLRSIRAYAGSVLSFLDALSVERVILVGHSMGGAITQTLALENPDRLLGIGLIGTGARLRVLPAFMEGLLSDFHPTAHEINEAEFSVNADLRFKQLSEQQLLACHANVVHNDFAACNEFDIMARVDQIQTPALIICGREDRMTPVKYSEYLASRLPNAQLQVIDGAGHMVMIEKPTEVNRALWEWVGALSLRAAM